MNSLSAKEPFSQALALYGSIMLKMLSTYTFLHRKLQRKGKLINNLTNMFFQCETFPALLHVSGLVTLSVIYLSLY